MAKKEKINVQGTEITVVSERGDDYISLTDMANAKHNSAGLPSFVLSAKEWIDKTNATGIMQMQALIGNKVIQKLNK